MERLRPVFSFLGENSLAAESGAFLTGAAALTGLAFLAGLTAFFFAGATDFEAGFETLDGGVAFLTVFAGGTLLRKGDFATFFLGNGLVGGFLTALAGDALTEAFWTLAAGFTVFPEDFRDGEVLWFFFNGEQVEPREPLSRGRGNFVDLCPKVKYLLVDSKDSLQGKP